MFLSLDGTLVVQLVNFAIFFALLSVVFLRPVGRAIARRREYINGLVSDYDRYQGEAQSLRAQAESVRGAARREAENVVAAARAKASNEAAEVSARYAKTAQGVKDDAHATAGSEYDAARAGENQAARSLAAVMLEKVLPEAAR